MDLYLDTETFNEVPIRNGTYVYAESVEVMIVTWAIDDGQVQLWDATEGSDIPDNLLMAILEAEWIVMHKSDFDRNVLRHARMKLGGRRVPIVVPTERIWDTMIQARAHGLPGGLDKLCEIFKLPAAEAKDKAGRKLIQLFCKPPPANQNRPRATRLTHPVEWARFKDYAKQDIVSMRAIRKLLPTWNYPEREHALWQLNERINDRGVKVDLDLARAAIDTVAKDKKKMDARTQELTDDTIRSTTQRDALMRRILAEHGVDLPDMTSTTLERRIEDPNLPWMVRELLAIRLQVSTTSNSKYNTLLKAVCADGRLRGMLQFCGAPRTGRWSGQVVQLQNLPRPDMDADDIEFGIRAMKAGAADLFFDHPTKLASNALRGFIVADKGKKLVVSDLSGIEARVLPWLAEEEWKVQAFRELDAGTGPDIYRSTAAKMLFKDVADITKEERQSHGKHPELACGYGGSKGALFAIALLFNYIIDEDEAMAIVRQWRSIHPAIADWDDGFWARLDASAREAILNPGRIVQASFNVAFERWRNWLKMHLPSGGFLSYAAPGIHEDPRRPGQTGISFMGINSYTKRWERLFTYGGKLAADVTQRTARDILAHNLPEIEAAGYHPELLVHDEVLSETLDSPDYSVHELNTMLARHPPWVPDNIPLVAGGFESYRYRKDG